MQPGSSPTPDDFSDSESKPSDFELTNHALSAERQARDAGFANDASEFGAGVRRAPGSVLSTIGGVLQTIGGLFVWSGAKLGGEGSHETSAQLTPAPPRANVDDAAIVAIHTLFDSSAPRIKASSTPPPDHRTFATPNSPDPVDAKPDFKPTPRKLARELGVEPESRHPSVDPISFEVSPGSTHHNSTPDLAPPEPRDGVHARKPKPAAQPRDPDPERMEVEKAVCALARATPATGTPFNAPSVARSPSLSPPRDTTPLDSNDYLHDPSLTLQEKVELQKERMYRRLFGSGRRAEQQQTAPSLPVNAKRALNAEPSRRKKRRTNRDAQEYRPPSGVEVDANEGPSRSSRGEKAPSDGKELPRMRVRVRVPCYRED